jgi:hypothetical protein
MMGLLKEGKVRHEENSQARGIWSQQRARAERKRVECHCKVLVELAHCAFFAMTVNHCEARSAVAIQTALQVALSFGMMEPPSGLPRRFAPRNDEVMVKLERRFVLRNKQDEEKRKNPRNAGRHCEGWEEKRGSGKGRF